MYSQDYLRLMNRLGLSTHPQQLERRKAKYPAHFKQKKDGRWFITPSLSYFLQDCRDLTANQAKLKGGEL